MKLSENFTWEEFVYSDTANMKGIKNDFRVPDQYKENAKTLCQRVLQRVRNRFGPIIISSGYSCPELARALGRGKNSQHNFGQAADIVSRHYPNLEIAHWIKDNLEFDQLIYEQRTRKSGEKYDWVHVSWNNKEENRNEVLTSPIGGGYQRGLPELKRG